MSIKLKVSDIAMYLPYGLKRYCPSSNVLIHDYTPLEFSQNIIDSHDDFGWKPILRPLSDLDKYGDDIPNCHKLNLILGGGENYGKEYIQHLNGDIDIEIEIDCNYSSYYMLSYKTIQKINNFLIENLYDINNLIGQGLAIDINSLKTTKT